MVKINTKVGQESSIKVTSSVGSKGAQGFQGVQGPLGNQGIDGLYAGQGAQGSQGTQGLQGTKGDEGAFGGTTFSYVYDRTSTADSDPGSGRFKFSSVNFNTASHLYISKFDGDGTDISSFLLSLANVTSEDKANITLRIANSVEVNISVLKITSAFTLTGDYFAVPIDYISGEIAFIDESSINISFARFGDKGIQGQQGTQGLQGDQGVQGAQGLDGKFAGQGAQGTQGIQGLQGVGAQGLQGDQGVQGTQGLSHQGTQGIQGVQSSQGNQGTQGLSHQGTQGLQGSIGIQPVARDYTITVSNASGTNKFYIDNVQQDTLYLLRGQKYTFDQSDSSNSSAGYSGVDHPFRISETMDGSHDGGSAYSSSDGWTDNGGTLGTDLVYTFVVPYDAPTNGNLYYYCTNHSGMGGSIKVKFIDAEDLQGIQGLQGDQGTQGLSNQGSQGVQGLQGKLGVQGGQGVQGGIGSTGAQGNQGLQGLQGLSVQGDQGIQGLQGKIGIQGDQGVQGLQGSQGLSIQGDQGVQGLQGKLGVQGGQGVQGGIGSTGAQGNQGLQGLQGLQGESVQGSQGVQGLQGVKGDQGAQGLQGLQGKKGEDGNFGGATFDYTFSTDVTDSDPGAGNLKFNNSSLSSADKLFIDDQDSNSTDIQSYLRTIDDSTSTIKGHFRISNRLNSNDFALFTISGTNSETDTYHTVNCSYVSGSATSFDNSEDIIITFARSGDKGDTGEKGNQGNQGVQSAQGNQGLQGLSNQGSQGLQGEQGPQGLQGLQGLSVQGGIGSTGAQGNQGLQGLQGESVQGNQGVQGLQGKIGIQGDQGVQGGIGSTGAQGNQGLQGLQGPQGLSVQGSQGVQGLQGKLGVQGDQGVQGLQGLSVQGGIGSTGAQGNQGLQGLQGPQGLQGKIGDALTIIGNVTSVTTSAPHTQLTSDDTEQSWYGSGPESGDGVIANDTGHLWVYNGSDWDDVGEIKGPQGNQGVQGLQGKIGIQGDQGVQGLQGKLGVQGGQGVQGPQGLQGLQGIIGDQVTARSYTITASGGKYYVDGVQQDTLYLIRGQKYVFAQDQSSNNTHEIRISTTSDGTHGGGSQYTSGWTYTGTAGTDGEGVFIVPYDAPDTLHYYCVNHPNMGGEANIRDLTGSDLQGTQGLQGESVQGEQGVQGLQGKIGIQGDQGVQGGIGSTGAQGRQGVQGNQGPQGLQGLQGLSVQGNQGLQGKFGIQGDQGVQGGIGSTGAQGRQGVQGPQGLQGLQGLSVQGNQGSQGVQGGIGSTGAQGNQGVQGLSIQGDQGVQGLQGKLGVQGGQGVQGGIGSTGAQGNQGLQGLQGESVQGSQGVQGPQGVQNAQGTQGTQGVQGPQGVQNAQGTQGVQGPQGVQNTQGTQGVQGPQGLQGLQGKTGPVAGSADQVVYKNSSNEPAGSNNLTFNGTTLTTNSLVVQNDAEVEGDLFVTGNISIGGTTGIVFANELQVSDNDIILGVTTDANGNDVSTDTTANHGGIAVASTEGNPLITLVNPGVGETLAATYKKIMWFKTSSFTGLSTDAWISNYAMGIGTFRMVSDDVLAVGGNVSIHGALRDTSGDKGTSGQILTSTETGINWVDPYNAGLQGDQGVQGNQGPQGAQGLQGRQGVQGNQGPQGLQGLQGLSVQGSQGLQGKIGIQGDQGVQGGIGSTGAQGNQGLQGPQGLQGLQGKLGIQGDQGVQGGIGSTGAQGRQGVQGPQGLQGLQGKLGIQGDQGVQGGIGSTGAQGRQGVQGLQGKSVQGSQGVQATQGLQGLQGLSNQGSQGVQGPQGLQGLQGKSVQGSQGVQGPQGLQGLQGLSVQGNQGVQGPAAAGGGGKFSTTHPSGDSFTGIGTTSAVGIGTRIEIHPYDTQNDGTLSFEGSAGQLFSITNQLSSGSIFSVNDISGIPSIDVDADGTIQLAPVGAGESVGIGTTRPQSPYKLHVVGDTNIDGTFTVNGAAVSGGGGGSIGIQSGGTEITTEASTINFVGSGITMSDDGSVTDITIPTVTRTATRVVATNAQTAFTVSSYDTGLIDVYLNGAKLDSTEYTETDSTTITLTTGASTGDIFESVSYSNFTGVSVDSATTATTATTATNVTVADESSDTTCFPLFVTAATGDLPPKSGSNLTFDSSTGILGATTFQGNLDVAGLLKEGVNITAGKLSANTNIDLANGMVHLFTTTETATSTPNIRVDASTTLGSSMSSGESITVVLISAAAAAGYSAQLTIDGSAVTEEWLGGSAPSEGGSGGYDVYTYNIIKTDSGFVVLANLVNFA